MYTQLVGERFEECIFGCGARAVSWQAPSRRLTAGIEGPHKVRDRRCIGRGAPRGRPSQRGAILTIPRLQSVDQLNTLLERSQGKRRERRNSGNFLEAACSKNAKQEGADRSGKFAQPTGVLIKERPVDHPLSGLLTHEASSSSYPAFWAIQSPKASFKTPDSHQRNFD